MNYGKELKKLRLRKGLNIKDVAKMTNISESLISFAENNKKNLAIDKLQSILAYYGLNLSLFFSNLSNSESKSNLDDKILLHFDKNFSLTLCNFVTSVENSCSYQINLSEGQIFNKLKIRENIECYLIVTHGDILIFNDKQEFVISQGSSTKLITRNDFYLRNHTKSKSSLVLVTYPSAI